MAAAVAVPIVMALIYCLKQKNTEQSLGFLVMYAAIGGPLLAALDAGIFSLLSRLTIASGWKVAVAAVLSGLVSFLFMSQHAFIALAIMKQPEHMADVEWLLMLFGGQLVAAGAITAGAIVGAAILYLPGNRAIQH